MSTIVIVSGYFNPLHRGHVRMIQAAKKLGDTLVVIVNNDEQQHMKKGKIIMSADERMEVVAALRDVDDVVLSVDHTRAIPDTLGVVAERYAGHKLIFANGGDQQAAVETEANACRKYQIEARFGVGGNDKPQSSSNINQALGHE